MTLPSIFDLCHPREDVAKGTISDSDYKRGTVQVQSLFWEEAMSVITYSTLSTP
jgi:hypothetical protein